MLLEVGIKDQHANSYRPETYTVSLLSMIGERLMTSNEIKDVILEIIQDIDEDAELASIKADVPLRDQIDLDSMDFLDIVMELRKRYKLQIPEADYPELASLDSCVNYLEPRLKEV